MIIFLLFGVFVIDKIDNNTIIVDTSNNVIKVDYTKFAPTIHTHTWSDIDKTGSSILDLGDVTTPTTSNVYANWDGTQIVWKEVFAKAILYQPGMTYTAGDLITDSDYTDLFIATTTFTATDLLTDVSNGYLISVTSSSSGTTYKQYDYTGVAGDTITIPLTKPNSTYDRHVFVLQKQTVSAADILPFRLDYTDPYWNYDLIWVIMDTTVHLKKSDVKLMVTENVYYKTNIDINDYKDIVLIDVETL